MRISGNICIVNIELLGTDCCDIRLCTILFDDDDYDDEDDDDDDDDVDNDDESMKIL